MIEPVIALIGAAGYVVGNLVHQVGRHYLSDKSTRLNIDLRREELSAIELRFNRDLQERRSLKLLEIQEHYNNTRKLNDHEWRMERWPLDIQPMDFIQYSSARSTSPLNIIFTKTPAISAHEHASAMALLAKPIASVSRRTAMFGGDIIFHNEVRRKSSHTGHGLPITLWNLLQTEATVIIEADVSDSDLIAIDISQWGTAFSSDDQSIHSGVRQNSITIDLSSLAPDAHAERQAVLELGIASIITLLGDAFRVLQRPHAIQTPLFPRIMQSALPKDTWDTVAKAYLAIYAGVAVHSPIIASELAAEAALTAHEASLTAFASALVEKALELYRETVAGAMLSDAAVLAMLVRQRRISKAPCALERALRIIRGLPDVALESSPPVIDLADLAKILNNRFC